MEFNIVHMISYEYSRAVFLEPHELRLQPRTGGEQTLLDFDLHIEPEPAGRAQFLDGDGNEVTNVWFDGQYPELTVTACTRVENRRENPFDFLLRADQTSLPLKYDGAIGASLQPMLQREESAAAQDEVAIFAERIMCDVDHQLLPFIVKLNDTLYTDLKCIHREEGDPWPPAQTLAECRGACRDLAVLFIDACRSVGIAARFVSGYQEGDSIQEQRELHAWAEIYVPGGGWRGYDPTYGLAVADRHIAIAAAATPSQAAPMIGSFRGTGATAVMKTAIQLQVTNEPAALVQVQQQ